MLYRKNSVVENIKRIGLILCASLFLVACDVPGERGQFDSEAAADKPVWLNMAKEFPETQNLPEGNGQKAKVIVLIGQSNATGCSLNSYLEKNLGAESYAKYEKGFENVWINYCLDDQKYTSHGEFGTTDLTCAAGGCFGPEVGIAERLAEEYPDETIFILKYTMSGYSLHHHWLSEGKRGSIYEAFMIFAKQYMDTLLAHNYDAKIGAICWMQGESDTTYYKASKYYDNQKAFVGYLREDFKDYAEGEEIYFIDAGISNSPYCEPAYPEINEAKEKFGQDSQWNIYFPTISEGLTIHLEPEGDPDWGHYDALSELKLGQLFGEKIIDSYKKG